MPGRSEKIRESDPGITIGGVSLEKHIEEKEKQEKENDLEDTRKEEIGTKVRGKKKVKPRERFKADPRKVSRRVRRLSDYEIRKEYGVKAKPFSSLTKNVMYCIYNSGDTLINSRAIAAELDKPLPDVSSALSNVYKKLKNDGMIYRKKVGLAYQYCLTNEGLAMGFEELYIKYFPGPGGVPGARKKRTAAVPTEVEAHKAMLNEEYSKLLNEVLDRVEKIETLENTKMHDLKKALIARVEAIENDGLADTVERLATQVDQMFQMVNAPTKDEPDYRYAGDQRELNVNFNIRFLFG